MPYHTIDSMNWRPTDDAVIPRWVTIKNCATGLARACGRNIMPKVRVFGKEGSTALHCQKPGPTALEVFSARSAVGPALPKSRP